MRYLKTPLAGVYLVELEKREDARGFFARVFCQREFGGRQLETTFVQCNNSHSVHKGTLRGLHYQLPPKQEVKLVRCIRGALYDVVLDLRLDSPSFGKSFGAELTADNRTMMYVPKGCAHGFVSLVDDTEIFYFVSEYYSAELERGVRWNDPAFRIAWPLEPSVISDRDSSHPDYCPDYHHSPSGACRR